MTGTLFLHRDVWTYSVPAPYGFRHITVGRITGLGTRELAEARLAELLSREDGTHG